MYRKTDPMGGDRAGYAAYFSKDDLGSPAKSSRISLCALILKERLGVSDRDLVDQIGENLYLQYFLGSSGYREEAPHLSTESEEGLSSSREVKETGEKENKTRLMQAASVYETKPDYDLPDGTSRPPGSLLKAPQYRHLLAIHTLDGQQQ